jgi:hypothetical protein
MVQQTCIIQKIIFLGLQTTAKVDMMNSIVTNDIDTFLVNITCVIHSVYHHIVLKASQDKAFQMLFDTLVHADWSKIEHNR